MILASWRGVAYRYYRTDDGRWVAADDAGWIPGSWRTFRGAERGVRKYIKAVTRQTGGRDAGAVAATGSAPAVPPGRATSRMAERPSEQQTSGPDPYPAGHAGC